jgi:uncharacterized protein YbjQ (UPF0145 family)
MKITATVIAAAAAISLSSLAIAADETVNMPIKDGLEAGKHTKNTIGDDIKLYFGKQKTPAVDKKLWEGSTTQKSMRKSQQERCDTAFVSAILRLQDRARKEGGNAVVGITSAGSNDSATEYTCTSGRVTGSVTLRGTVVTLKK